MTLYFFEICRIGCTRNDVPTTWRCLMQNTVQSTNKFVEMVEGLRLLESNCASRSVVNELEFITEKLATEVFIKNGMLDYGLLMSMSDVLNMKYEVISDTESLIILFLHIYSDEEPLIITYLR